MMRCELHDPMGNQCERGAVLTLFALVGIEPLEAGAEWRAAACNEHAWEATANAARHVALARAAGRHDARVVAVLEEAGRELLGLLQGGITLGERWPLAQPWAQR
jgi:hypothetical protein